MSSGRSNKSNNGGSGRGSSGRVSLIPDSSKKMVQSLKEIVNCPEDEIYYTLKECNMDPSETVQRLLAQDPFQEVKSKKEKKKEIKETSDPRPRGVNTSLNRGGRGGAGATRYDGRSGVTQYSFPDTGVLRGKPAYKKENGTADFSTSSTSAYGLPRNNINPRSVSYSGSLTSEYQPQTTGTIDGIPSSSQPSSGFQPAWVGAPGQVSMADIVKMGRRKAVASSTPNTLNDTSRSQLNAPAPYHSVNPPIAPAPLPRETHHGLETLQESAPEVSESTDETGVLASQHASAEEWNLLEQSSARAASVVEPSDDAEGYTDPSLSSNVHPDGTNSRLDSWPDEVQGTARDIAAEHPNKSYIESASESARQIHTDNSGAASHYDADSFSNMNSYPPQRHTFEHHEGNGGSSQSSIPNYGVSSAEDVLVAVSSAAVNLQQLSLQEDQGVRSAEVNPAVIIPNHLQIPTAECSHLSFGSFGSVAPGSYASNSMKVKLEEASVAANTSSDHPGTRGPEYFGDEHLQSTSDGTAAPRTSAGAASYDSPSQPEVMKQDAEVIHGHQYNFPTSVPSYALENSQLNAAFYEQANSQMHNLAPLSSVMQAYSNSLQGNPLAPTAQPARESPDLTYSSFLTTQSVPTKYSTSGSSINGPSLSMPENVKSSMFSMPQLPGANIATGPALPQHLVHPYSQTALPLGHFANMIGYPFIPPQSYAYLPPGYQQAYTTNSTYHQSPAAVHNAALKYATLAPQYKSSIPGSSLPQSASVASAYGGFGSSVNVPGSFPLNPSSTAPSSTIGYEDVMSSQYKESNHFLPLQQNESSTVWVQGPGGSRTAIPASTYYSFTGQGQQQQQHNAFRQGGTQQPSQQHYGNLGYQNFYHSQTGIPQEHQQQTPNDPSQGQQQQQQQASKQQQIWQHSY